ncbi:hypothetical protein JOF41_001487 [Saccharothrix coeruleofusca]|uniref:DUF2087 domain-containing protein n=1 Tax=Saccharothrix coeruleofusca TaxID=33919 RepID=UPI001AEB6731|nr:DUF2087 domain-containing protein [Saccharothrix coeruleofusca]MBP2335309.1 hypothetical protein [Saccharothrix coeruleofusca]
MVFALVLGARTEAEAADAAGLPRREVAREPRSVGLVVGEGPLLVLRQWCEGGEVDHVISRRYPVDEGLLDREGGQYRRAGGPVGVRPVEVWPPPQRPVRRR